MVRSKILELSVTYHRMVVYVSNDASMVEVNSMDGQVKCRCDFLFRLSSTSYCLLFSPPCQHSLNPLQVIANLMDHLPSHHCNSESTSCQHPLL